VGGVCRTLRTHSVTSQSSDEKLESHRLTHECSVLYCLPDSKSDEFRPWFKRMAALWVSRCSVNPARY
jgi:hypothetical protein